MATFSNNFFLERKSENIQDNDSTKMWTKKWNKYFSFVINDQTTFMYQFKLRTSNNSYAFFNCLLHQNQQISLILSKQLKFSSKSKYCSSMHLKKRSTILKKLGFELKQKKAQYRKAQYKKLKIYFLVNSKPTKKSAVQYHFFPFQISHLTTIWNINHFICTSTCRFSNLHSY